MDCSNARLFLHFARPQAGELDPAEAEALDVHLARCQECAGLARGERRLDQHLGRAMRQVEVPPHLRGQLLARLAAERDAWYRRWVARGLRGGAAAAALLLAVWGWRVWDAQRKPELNLREVFNAVNLEQRTKREVQDSLKHLGAEVRLPDDLNYALLASYGVTELPGVPGKKVAQLDFVPRDSGPARPGPARRARVYIVSAKDFNLKSLAAPHDFPDGYPNKLQVKYESDHADAYLIFYTGDNLGWLFDTA